MQFHKIVVGLDFTAASLAAARWVANFAPDAEILLVHVLPEPRVPSFLRPHVPPTLEIATAAAPAIYGGLRGLADLIGSDRARFDIVTGSPPDALALVAGESNADLVCVGRGRRRRGSARFGATTAQRLLGRTRIPALIVPAWHRGAPARVLAAVDERPGGNCVFEAACRLGAERQARVEALHIIEPEVEAFVRAAREALEPTERARQHAYGRGGQRPSRGNEPYSDAWLRERAHEWVDAMLDDVAVGASRVASAVGSGDAGPAIVRQAWQSNAGLIVIGRGGDASHACVPAGALPLGSATRLVVWAAPCPVLVVPLDGSRSGVPGVPGIPGEEWRRRRDRQVADTQVVELSTIMRSHSGSHTEPLPPATWRRRGSEEDGVA